MKFLINIKSIYLLLILSGNIYSQNLKLDSLSTFEFKWSNDFQYKTDKYYTNGFSFEVFTNLSKNNPVNFILFPITSNEFELFSITLTQDIFTPKDKFNIKNQLNGDRPFAAYILIGFKKVAFNPFDKIKYYSEIQIGILGPVALGEQTQNSIHRNISTSAEVIGWENQIKNDLMINYSASIEKVFSNNNWIEFSGISLVKLGFPYTDVNFGFQSRIGVFDLFPKDFEFLSNKKWQLFLNLSANASIIGYNTTLQSGIFSKSNYSLTEINRFIGKASFGITAIYKRLKMEYMQHFNTPEFPKADSHSWGYLLIKFVF